MKFIVKKWSPINIVFLLCLMAITIYQLTTLEPKTSQIEEKLRVEFDRIIPLPGASVLQSINSHKENNAILGNSYYLNQSLEEIQKYYVEQLTENGWQYFKEERIKYKGIDYGGKSINYRKGDYICSLEYSGSNPNINETFSFYVSWGLSI
jgi:hypothetical protein